MRGNERATIKAHPATPHLPRPYGNGIPPQGWRTPDLSPLVRISHSPLFVPSCVRYTSMVSQNRQQVLAWRHRPITVLWREGSVMLGSPYVLG
jgi:hypothetical protein